MSMGGSTTPTGGYWEIDHGWDVFGSDGEKVGDVSDVQTHYITVSKGLLFKTDLYIPVSAITAVEHDRVYLNVTKDQIEAQGWDRIPEVDTTVDRQMVGTGFRDTAEMDTVSTATGYKTTEVVGEDRLRVPVVEEELTVGKREVEQGRIRVRKDVVEEEQAVNVPLRQEEVHISRRATDSAYTGDVPADAFQEVDIEIPVRGEEADVSKQAVVREEVEIHKHVREENQRVADTVRREEVHVDESGTGLVESDVTTRDPLSRDPLLDSDLGTSERRTTP